MLEKEWRQEEQLEDGDNGWSKGGVLERLLVEKNN